MSQNNDSDESDWFDKDEDELVQELVKLHTQTETTEHIKGGFEAEDFLRNHAIESAQFASSQIEDKSKNIATSILKKISKLEALDIFLYTVTNKPNFFINQIRPNDNFERVMTYTNILVVICKLELPIFQEEILKHFVANESLINHYCCFTAKLFNKNYEQMWDDTISLNAIVNSMQTLFLQSYKLGLATPKYIASINCIKRLIATSNSPRIKQLPCCVEFVKQINLISETYELVEESTLILKEEIPTLKELLDFDSTSNTTSKKLLPNSKYSNVVEYINVQKNLLREDFTQSLRECVQSIKTTQSLKSLCTNQNIYEDVRIVLNENFINAQRHELIFVDILGKHRSETSNARSERYNSFKVGTLLCFTTTCNFDNLILATTTFTEIDVLNRGYIGIEVESQYNIENIYNQSFIMFESPAFFVPYKNVYNYLNNCITADIPLMKYIIFGEKNVAPPKYLKSNSTYKYQGFQFNPMRDELPKVLPLNETQLMAYRQALQQELCLIQGPPGTGKTHLSLEIMKTLIENAATPIVLTTYTNDSLDKFLINISKYTTKICRFGSQSSYPEISKFNLNKTNYQINNRLKYLYSSVQAEYKEKFQQLQVLIRESDGTNDCYNKILNEQKLIKIINEKLYIIRAMFQYYGCRNSSIIAMTTTFAAKTNFLFRLLKCSVVMLEEAAEILESHVLPCLTQYTQHVILIGDHMQLKPFTSSYNSSHTTNMNISLFERLINQSIDHSVLLTQYRMRVDISDLITSTIYPKLLNDSTVLILPNVKGVKKNVFFVAHDYKEMVDNASSSFYNKFECEKIESLAAHLIHVGKYFSEDIVVLSPYQAQVNQLTDMFKKNKFLDKIKVTTVDSFQGLEANIILLSFVRSNTANSLGFLRDKNRICVALSRAKIGLYMIGNLNMFSSHSRIWNEIKQKLIAKDNVGVNFPYVFS